MAEYKLTAKQEANVGVFKSVLNDAGIRNRIKKSLGKNAGSFMASMLDLYESDTTLLNCDPTKVAMECLKAASLNLPIVKGLGYAYVVPFKGTPTFIVGYKGYIQLAMRSGQYKIINADCIYEGEEIIFDRLSGQIEIVGQKTSDKAKGYFAYFRLINGFEKSFYMSVEDVKAYGKKYSPSYDSKYSPWHTEFDAMAKKTVLRQIFKYGPMSTEMQMAEAEEIKSAEQRAQEEVNTYANQEIIDIPDEPSRSETIYAESSEEAVNTRPPIDDGYDSDDGFPPEPPF